MKPPPLNKNGRPSRNGGISLEQTFQTNDTPESRHVLEGQLRECYGRVVYSHKTHEKCADILLARLSTIKLWQILLSAFTTGSFMTTFFGSGNVGAAIGVVLSTTLLVLNAYTKNYDLGKSLRSISRLPMTYGSFENSISRYLPIYLWARSL